MKEIKQIFIVGLFALSLFALIYFPIEFYITETKMLIDHVNPLIGSILLTVLIALLSLINWDNLSNNRIIRFTLIFLISFSALVSLNYRSKKKALEYLPKIYNVTNEWGIQAKIVSIKGNNFFPAWKKGKVVVGNEEMTTKSWDEKIIVAEQQVPSRFGWFDLYIIRDDGIKSNRVPFEVKNPSNLY